MDSNEIFNKLLKMRQTIEADTEESLLESENALLYDVALTLGLSREQAAELAGDNIENQPPASTRTVTDFDSGLGIGGAGHHDLHSEAMELIARGEMRVVEHERRGPMPNGQLWQPCSVRGCDIEPVCLGCERCHKHCRC